MYEYDLEKNLDLPLIASKIELSSGQKAELIYNSLDEIIQ
jgi:hypothetical protein